MTQNIHESLFLLSVAGFNPTWNESFQFDVYVPELALVRFLVEDYDSTSDNEFVGQYTLPFNSLKMGEFTDICNLFHTVKALTAPHFLTSYTNRDENYLLCARSQ